MGCDPFSKYLGMKVDDVGSSYARVSVPIKEEFCNAAVRAHGGVVFALADQAFAVAANSRGFTVLGLEVKINYFQAAIPGDVITAEATPIDIRKRVSLWNIEITNQRGEKIAAAQCMGYHLID